MPLSAKLDHGLGPRCVRTAMGWRLLVLSCPELHYGLSVGRTPKKRGDKNLPLWRPARSDALGVGPACGGGVSGCGKPQESASSRIVALSGFAGPHSRRARKTVIRIAPADSEQQRPEAQTDAHDDDQADQVQHQTGPGHLGDGHPAATHHDGVRGRGHWEHESKRRCERCRQHHR